MNVLQEGWSWYRGFLIRQKSTLGKLIVVGFPLGCVCLLCFGLMSALLPLPSPTQTAARATVIPSSTANRAKPSSTQRASRAPLPTALATESATDAPSPTVTPEKNARVIGEATATVNIRAQPGRTARLLGQLQKGEQFEITGRTKASDWYEFEKGWVIASAIQVVGEINRVPVITDIKVQSDVTIAAPPTKQSTTTPDHTDCEPAYPDLCLPIATGDTLNCGDIPYTHIRVLPPDPYQLDQDGNGIGCEGN